MSDPMQVVLERSVSISSSWDECRTRVEKSYGVEMVARAEKIARDTKYQEWFAREDAHRFNEGKALEPILNWRTHFLSFLKFHLNEPSQAITTLDGTVLEMQGGSSGLPNPEARASKKFMVDTIGKRLAILGSNPSEHFERGFKRWVVENLTVDGQAEPEVRVVVEVGPNCLTVHVDAKAQFF